MCAKGVHEGNRKDPQTELALKLVSDLERGVDLEDAGWMRFPPDVVNKLITSGCFEENEKGIRVFLPNPPKVEDPYVNSYLDDASAAVSVLEEMTKVAGDERLQTSAICTGLGEMLVSSSFPVLPQAMLERDFGPGSWFVNAMKSTPDLVTFLVSNVSGVSIENSSSTKCKDTPRVMAVLMWEKVSEAFDWRTLRQLGILWYAHLLGTRNRAGCDTNMLLVQNETKKMFKWDQEFPLEEGIQKLEELTAFEFNKERKPVADWERIFRFPPWWL